MRYEIEGNNLPVVICHLEEGEKIITEQGAMAWMTPNMKMETNSNGIGRAVARTFSGESFFQNIYYPSPHPKYVAEKHADTISQKKCKM